MNSTPVIIVGTGRSGTSLTSAICDYLGIYMGDNLIEADRANPLGYWEDKYYTRRNQAYVKDRITKTQFFDEIRPVSNHRSATYKHWGIKHPSISHILPEYIEFFDNPKIIWCQRDRGGVVQSMENNYDNPQPPEEVYDKRWESMESNLSEYSEKLIIDFDNLVGDTESVVEDIVNFTGVLVSEEDKETAASFAVNQKEDLDILYVCPPIGSFGEKKVNKIASVMADERFNIQKMPQSTPPTFDALNKAVEKFNHDYMVIGSREAVLDRGEDIRRRLLTDLVTLDRDIITSPVKSTVYDCCDYIRGDYLEIPEERRRGMSEIDASSPEMMVISKEVLNEIDFPASAHTGLEFCRNAKDKGFKVWAHWDYTSNK